MTGSALRGRKPKWEPCPGSGKPPKTVRRATIVGLSHEYPGRGECPVCGRDVGYRQNAGMARHKAPDE